MPAKRFTIDEANAALPGLIDRLERLKVFREQIVAEAEVISEKASHNGGGQTPPRSQEAAAGAREQIEAIAAMGIVLRDAEAGLVDFPSEREGEPVFLCWRSGEDRVAFWHPPDSGFSGRQPL